jgi:hypothetical protein
MPFQISASADLTLLMLRAHGRGTAEEGQRALHAVQAHLAYSQGVAILIDALDLAYTPSPAEARVFAGLFATAFPCSPIAIAASPDGFYEAARRITELSMERGAVVAAFDSRHAALEWLTTSGGTDAGSVEDEARTAAGRRVHDEVVIPYTLREKIETTRVEVDGQACPLRLDSACGRPTFEPEVAEVTVSTEYCGASRCATVDLRVSSLDDEESVVSAVAEAMRVVLAGARTAMTATASAARH